MDNEYTSSSCLNCIDKINIKHTMSILQLILTYFMVIMFRGLLHMLQ